MIKEGIGTKGPTLSTYISIPGRYLVLMPALGRVGVSRKIEDDEIRRRLRDIMLELNPPKGLGFIVRTAGIDRTKRELSRDLAYLLRLWKVIVRRIKKLPAPVDIYEESDMIIRTIRDIFTADVDAIYIDEPAAYERAKEFLQLVMPRLRPPAANATRARSRSSTSTTWRRRSPRSISRQVPLKSGGSIVIDQTEALVAIDVNSGNFRAEDYAEETAYQMNLHCGQGNRPPDPPPRPGRRDRQRLHRHAQGKAPPRRGAGAARRGETRPGPDQDPPHQPLRPDRNDPPADPPEPQAERLTAIVPLAAGRAWSRRPRAWPSKSSGC